MPRNNLLLIRTGRNSLHRDWLAQDLERNWDCVTIPYEEHGKDGSDTEWHTVHGHKFIGISAFLRADATWREYQFICWPDDDLRVPPGNWSRFFDICADVQPALAAPALTPDSISSHPVTIQQPQFRYRVTTFVEIMMPCFRFDTLERLGPTLALSTVGIGWGLDYVWPAILQYQGIIVADATPVTHWRPSAIDTPQAVLAHQEMERMIGHFRADRREVTLQGFT